MPTRPPLYVPPPCRHLGPHTGEAVPCPTCGGKVALVLLRACSRHGSCAETRVVTRAGGEPVRCCRVCPDYEAGGAGSPTA